MRLFLLPISTRRTLIYCEKLKVGDAPSYADRIVNKANSTWVGWEKATGGWQKKLTVYGNQLFKRIPFEEWGLKTLPALSATASEKAERTEVLFPSAFLPKESVSGVLQRLASDRQAFHRTKLMWSVIGMPLTAPFAVVPIVPNLPFFYVAFRAWSHYKALYGSRYLEMLLQKQLVNPSPSTTLDEMYAAGLIHPSREESRAAILPSAEELKSVTSLVAEESNNGTKEVMLLKRWNGKILAERFQLPEMEVEIERAVEQVELGIKADAEALTATMEKDRATSDPGDHEKKA